MIKKINPKNITGISFGADLEILEKAKIRMRQLGIRSFSEYVKQLIKYDLGLPNYIGSYIAQPTDEDLSADAVLEARANSIERKRKQNRIA